MVLPVLLTVSTYFLKLSVAVMVGHPACTFAALSVFFFYRYTKYNNGGRSHLLVIGLDAADKDLIERWAASGDLPTFKTLQDAAAWADVKNRVG